MSNSMDSINKESDMPKPLLFCTSSYQPLARAMMATKKFDEGKLARSIDSMGNPLEADEPFPDGERYHRLLQSVEDRKVILLGGTIDDRETMELYDIGNTLVDNYAAKLNIVIPYFGCSTQERAVNPLEAVKAKYRARLISSIPRADNGNRVYLMDLHSEGIPYYFENGIVARHIYAKSLVIEAAKRLAAVCAEKLRNAPADTADDSPFNIRITSCMSPDVDKILAEVAFDDFCLASTDTGRAKWVESLTRDMVKLGLPVHPAFIIKRRLSGEETTVMDISADVEGKIVIIYDDMIRTGGSLIKAAQAYLARGAAMVVAISTHAVLPNDSIKRLQDSGQFAQIVVTDSHPRALELQSDFLQVVSCAKLLASNMFNGRTRTS